MSPRVSVRSRDVEIDQFGHDVDSYVNALASSGSIDRLAPKDVATRVFVHALNRQRREGASTPSPADRPIDSPLGSRFRAGTARIVAEIIEREILHSDAVGAVISSVCLGNRHPLGRLERDEWVWLVGTAYSVAMEVAAKHPSLAVRLVESYDPGRADRPSTGAMKIHLFGREGPVSDVERERFRADVIERELIASGAGSDFVDQWHCAFYLGRTADDSTYYLELVIYGDPTADDFQGVQPEPIPAAIATDAHGIAEEQIVEALLQTYVGSGGRFIDEYDAIGDFGLGDLDPRSLARFYGDGKNLVCGSCSEPYRGEETCVACGEPAWDHAVPTRGGAFSYGSLLTLWNLNRLLEKTATDWRCCECDAEVAETDIVCSACGADVSEVEGNVSASPDRARYQGRRSETHRTERLLAILVFLVTGFLLLLHFGLP